MSPSIEDSSSVAENKYVPTGADVKEKTSPDVDTAAIALENVDMISGDDSNTRDGESKHVKNGASDVSTPGSPSTVFEPASERVPGEAPEKAPANTQELAPDKAPKEAPQEMLENAPDKAEEKTHDKLPDEMLAKTPDRPQVKDKEKDWPAPTDATVLRDVMQRAPQSVAQQVVAEFWQKCTTGDQRLETYLVDNIIRQASVEVRKKIMEIRGDDLVRCISEDKLDQILRARVKSMPAKHLVNMLAVAGRLGYSEDDLVGNEDDGEHVVPDLGPDGTDVDSSHHHEITREPPRPCHPADSNVQRNASMNGTTNGNNTILTERFAYQQIGGAPVPNEMVSRLLPTVGTMSGYSSSQPIDLDTASDHTDNSAKRPFRNRVTATVEERIAAIDPSLNDDERRKEIKRLKACDASSRSQAKKKAEREAVKRIRLGLPPLQENMLPHLESRRSRETGFNSSDPKRQLMVADRGIAYEQHTLVPIGHGGVSLAGHQIYRGIQTEKPYKCRRCGKGYKQSAGLKYVSHRYSPFSSPKAGNLMLTRIIAPGDFTMRGHHESSGSV